MPKTSDISKGKAPKIHDAENTDACASDESTGINYVDKEAIESIRKNAGYFVLDAVFRRIRFKIRFLVQKILNLEKDVDFEGLFKLLIYQRILNPLSIKETFYNKDNYLFGITKSQKLNEIYLVLDEIADKIRSLQDGIDKFMINSNAGRVHDVCYCSISSYSFTSDVENDHNLHTDFRTGLADSKNKAIFEADGKLTFHMCLYIDTNEIPISYKIYQKKDDKDFRKQLSNAIKEKKSKYKRIVAVSNLSINEHVNIDDVINNGDGYIIGGSLCSINYDLALDEWILDGDGYEYNFNKTVKYKSKTLKRAILNSDGKLVGINEMVIAYWSEHDYYKQTDNLDDSIKKLSTIMSLRPINIQSSESGDTINFHSSNKTSVDYGYQKLGYSIIFTSEVNSSDTEILNKYLKFSHAYDWFKPLNNDLEGRPAYVKQRSHTESHFMVSFFSIVILRIIQYKVLKYLSSMGSDAKQDIWYWSEKKIIEALNECIVGDAGGNYYLRCDTGVFDDLTVVFNAFNIDSTFLIPDSVTYNRNKINMYKRFTF
ncbi:MAG: hypothetical protein LBF68_00890 [Christensenellaceae bacterium]|jgi:hypothetical protein|nr:hypothetical protein [Christensenellaceae bacterium]